MFFKPALVEFKIFKKLKFSHLFCPCPLCCNPNFPGLFFIFLYFKCNFTIVKPKRKQALLGSNLLAISFMDELHPGRALNALLFYTDAGIPLWLRKPHCIVTNKIPIKTPFYQQIRIVIPGCSASFHFS